MARRGTIGTVGKVNLPKLEEHRTMMGGTQIAGTQISRGIKNDRSLGGSPSHKPKGAIRSGLGLNEGSSNLKIETGRSYDQSDVLQIEDFDETIDVKFVNENFVPYLKALYADLLMRSNNPNHLDKVTFIEYTKLPGIINDRLHFMFSNYKS